MPETKKGKKIHRAMRKQYGPKKGDEVFYAMENAGTLKGVVKKKPKPKKKKSQGQQKAPKKRPNRGRQ